MSNGSTVTNASAFKRRSLGKQVLFFIITLSLYGLYWSYVTAKQIDQGTNVSVSPWMVIIPILNLYALWKICKGAEAVTDQSGALLFILFIVFSPISWYMIQSGINKTAGR